MQQIEAIDHIARVRAEGWVEEISKKAGELELLLSSIGGFVGPDSLPAATVASAGLHVQAVKEQIPILRQAVRDIPLMEPAAAA